MLRTDIIIPKSKAGMLSRRQIEVVSEYANGLRIWEISMKLVIVESPAKSKTIGKIDIPQKALFSLIEN